MEIVPTCFLLLAKCVSSEGSNSLASVSLLITGNAQVYSQDASQYLPRCKQCRFLPYSSDLANVRINKLPRLFSDVLSSFPKFYYNTSDYMSSSEHFSTHTICNKLNSSQVFPPY